MPVPPLSRSHPGIRLPFEVLDLILSHLRHPLDLYRFSLVNREWYRASIDSPSWEDAFWRFYRPGHGEDEQQRKLTTSRITKRAKAMQAWLRETATSLPTADAAQPLLDSSNSGPPSTATALVSLPPFLESMLASSSRTKLDFHSIFIERMKLDQRFITELVGHAQRSCGILQDAHRLIQAYRDDAREVLSALCATQVAGEDEINRLLSSSDSSSAQQFRAIDLHTAAAQRRPCPHPALFLTLRFAAKEMLGHLQRRGAVLSLQGLQQRCHARGEGTQGTLKEEVARCRVGLQESLEDLALFRGGEKTQLGEYFDLLALFIWAELQTQDRCAPASNSDANGWQSLPRGSSRQLGARIVSILRSLGFGSAQQHQQKDLANHFIDICTLCPAQRVTSQPTLAAIICNVLQRLGVDAVPLPTPHRTFCLAIEDSPEPGKWPGTAKGSEWERWYIDVSDLNTCVAVEASEVEEFLTARGMHTSSAYMSPFSPRSMASSAVQHLSMACAHVMAPPHARQEDGHLCQLSLTTNGGNTSATGSPLTTLRGFLEGRQVPLVEPLLPATLATYLARLPSTTASAPRAEPWLHRSEAQYATVWIMSSLGQVWSRELETVLCSHLRRATFSAKYQPDVPLLLEMSTSPSPALLQLKGDVLAADEATSDGIGGYGGGRDVKTGRAYWTEEEKRQELDPTMTKKTQVKYRVGTIFTHRSDGYKAVVVGWDCKRRAEKDLRSTIKSDSPPPGPSQPYYHALDEDGQLRYVPQTAVEPMEVSSSRQAEEMMRALVKLLQVEQVGRCFATLRVQSEEGEQGGVSEEGGGGRVVLVMNAWMRGAWPFD